MKWWRCFVLESTSSGLEWGVHHNTTWILVEAHVIVRDEVIIDKHSIPHTKQKCELEDGSPHSSNQIPHMWFSKGELVTRSCNNNKSLQSLAVSASYTYLGKPMLRKYIKMFYFICFKLWTVNSSCFTTENYVWTRTFLTFLLNWLRRFQSIQDPNDI